MQLSEKKLSEARDTVQTLLEQLGLSTYLFEVEPRTDHWEVRIECAPNSVWQSSQVRRCANASECSMVTSACSGFG